MRVAPWERGRLARICGALALLAVCTAPVVAQQNWLGPNLAPSPGFEQADPQGLPVDWTCAAQPAGSARFALDKQRFLVGAVALRVEVPDTGSAGVRSKAFPVQPNAQYLVSVAFRSEGFGVPGKYSGVDGYVAVEWLDAAGKVVARVVPAPFPYNASDWDLRDQFVQCPANAAQGVLALSINNHSRETNRENVPSTLWLDAVQFRPYTPPPTPDWAKQKVPRIVEGGISTARVQSYQLAGLNMSGGKWSPIVPDPGSTYGSALVSPDGVGSGMMAHSPYFAGTPPGLYRAVLRCKAKDTGRPEKVGAIDVGSEFAGGRAVLDLHSRDFRAANAYQDFEMDFVLRTAGYWMFRVYTEGKQPFTADTVRIFPLMLFEDRQLLELYPGSEGAVAADLKPRRDRPSRGLLVAGPLFDEYRIVDAFHLTDWDMKLDTVFIRKSRSQTFPGFPETPEALFAHNVIYLCDVDASGLTLRQKHMIAEYVRRGGGLIVFGGHKTLERGSMRGSLLAEVLPVTIGEGMPPLLHFPRGAPVVKGAGHPTTDSADFSGDPVCFWMHDLPARSEAQTILTVEGKPAVVVGRIGQGRVACVAMTCLGSPAEGQTPFWQWSSWLNFLRDLSWWVAGQDDHFPAAGSE